MITTLGRHASHPWFGVADDVIVVSGKPITEIAAIWDPAMLEALLKSHAAST